jgi:DMSO reductase family type II enzyme chaperone
MNTETAVRRSQVYKFLADAFLYPADNWPADVPIVNAIARELDAPHMAMDGGQWTTGDLQSEHRRVFGLAGSLCYETEYGLPHEFRQSQELADLAGFYRAFGFDVGGAVRERPDHLAVELEFMCLLALKEAYAAQNAFVEHTAVSVDAQRKFIEDHLGRWIDLFAQSVALNAIDGPYLALARFAAAFVAADAGRLGARLEPRRLADVKHTPVLTDFSCGDCPIAATPEQGAVA